MTLDRKSLSLSTTKDVADSVDVAEMESGGFRNSLRTSIFRKSKVQALQAVKKQDPLTAAEKRITREILEEYMLGAEEPNVQLTPNSVLIRMLLLTEAMSEIEVACQKFYTLEDGSSLPRIESITFDKVIEMTVGGKPTPDKEQVQIKTIQLGTGAPFMKSLEMQQFAYQAYDNRSLWWTAICYIKMETMNGEVIEVGRAIPEGRVKETKQGLEVLALPKHVVSGPCMISGVGMHNAAVFCFQVIEADPGANLSMILPLCVYGKSNLGLVKPKEVRLRNGKADLSYREMTQHGLVFIEDPEVFALLQELWAFMTTWWKSQQPVNRLQADMFSLIDVAISNRDRTAIFSVLRLERWVNHLIRRRLENRVLPGIGERVKLRTIWRALSIPMGETQAIITNKPDLNVYSVYHLDPTWFRFAALGVTFLAQCGLGLLIAFHLFKVYVEEDTQLFPLWQGGLLTPLIGLYLAMLVFNQVSNFFAMKNALPSYSRSPVIFFDVLINVVGGVCVTIFSVMILAVSDEILDIVLNSLAAVFIVEMDDSMVFCDDDGTVDLYRAHLMQTFRKQLDSIDPKLYYTWMKFEEADSLFVDTRVIAITDKRPSATATLAPVTSIQFDKKALYHNSNSFLFVAESGMMTKSCSSIDLSFKWRDQGRGNHKGRVQIHLVDSNGQSLASEEEWSNPAPAEEERVQVHFDESSPLVNLSRNGTYIVLKAFVGGGGGHELHLRDFVLEADAPCYEAKGGYRGERV